MQIPQRKEFPPFQSRQEVVIHAPLQAVWEFGQDLTNIAEYHPRVKRVDLISFQGNVRESRGLPIGATSKMGKIRVSRKISKWFPWKGSSRLYLKILWGLPKCFQIILLKRGLLLLLRMRQKWNFGIIIQQSL